ncbi:maleylpyruvate isomerase N-terminal domain-containing protein [Rugosimonospora acidiphila]
MTRNLANKDFWLAALRTEGPAFREAVTDAPLDAPVPSCPGWTVAHLIGHLGEFYGFVLSHVGRGVTSRPEDTSPEEFQPPSGADPLSWWDERYQQVISTLDALDPDMPAWNWAPQAKTVEFWHRRAAHETTVHRWDAQFATINAEPIEPKLAADGVDEVLDTWLPAGRRRGPSDLVGVVGLGATDLDREWLVRLRADGGVALLDTDTLLDTDEHRERAVARGTASDLMLALYGRVGFDLLELAGDERLLEALRTG